MKQYGFSRDVRDLYASIPKNLNQSMVGLGDNNRMNLSSSVAAIDAYNLQANVAS
jgi:hypothetical protein